MTGDAELAKVLVKFSTVRKPVVAKLKKMMMPIAMIGTPSGVSSSNAVRCLAPVGESALAALATHKEASPLAAVRSLAS
jgi:hypothetical protein